MKKLIGFIIVIGIIIVGCSQSQEGTKNKIYENPWDGNPVMVSQKISDENEEIINKIDDRMEIEKIIKALRNADWQENVEVDIRPPDYNFIWNSYKHNVWINEEFERLELKIEGHSNYVSLSNASSQIVFEILTGKQL